MVKIKNITKENKVIRDRRGQNIVLEAGETKEINITIKSDEVFKVIEEKEQTNKIGNNNK